MLQILWQIVIKKEGPKKKWTWVSKLAVLDAGEGLQEKTMPMFADLQQNARNLPEKLTKAYAKQYSFGSLFCTCLPSATNTRLFTDAYLIQQTAYCLDFYPDVTVETKKLVLIGMYVYIWHQYDSRLQWFLNKPLLSLLQEHLGIESLANLDKTIYENSLGELGHFCRWVFKNRRFHELDCLYKLYPTDMQGNIHTQKDTLSSGSSSSWGTTLSGLMTQIGIKGLF